MGVDTSVCLLLRSIGRTICGIEASQACKDMLKAGIRFFDEFGVGLDQGVKLPSFLNLRESLTAGQSDWELGILTQR